MWHAGRNVWSDIRSHVSFPLVSPQIFVGFGVAENIISLRSVSARIPPNGFSPSLNILRTSAMASVLGNYKEIQPIIIITIYGVVCVQPAHFILGDWKDISVAHYIIIIRSDVSTFPIVIIFFRGCVPEMLVTSYSVIYCIYIPGKLGSCFRYYWAGYECI